MITNRKEIIFGGFLICVTLLVGFALASAPQWQGSDINYTMNEDSLYYHNLSKNITGFNDDVSFDINPSVDKPLYWTNATGRYMFTSAEIISSWIKIYNSLTGNLTINATYNNQTGFFEVPVQATNTSDPGADSVITTFEFVINATNDAPNFTTINTTYTLSAIDNLYEFLNASDEESHYPLIFNITFNTTYCTHAAWSGYNDNESCDLFGFGFNLTSVDNTSALINMTPNSTHVGVYYANVSVIDAGNLSLCPHIYCDNATYQQNKTTYYSQVVTFNIEDSLSINVTNCNNTIFNESQEGTCNITIRTKEASDNINISSYAILRNYASGQSGVSNTSWFYANASNASSNFVYNVTINITPVKTEIGNWTINFTVEDDNGESATEQIYVRVDRNQSLNDAPDLASITNVTTSINLETVINLAAYDDDFLIPDKNVSYGGFNETLSFNHTILNQSNLSQELTLSDFNITVLSMPVSGTNTTTAEIRFTPVLGDVGNYTINITVNDSDGDEDFELFDLSIISNSAPVWNESLTTTFIIYENNNTYINFSLNVSDPDGDTLTFSYTKNNGFPSFSLNTSTGEVNFTAVDTDVGQHIVNITASDGYLTNTSSFNFTVYNVNDAPYIPYLTLVNATSNETPPEHTKAYNGGIVNATEDNYTIIILWIQDDDLKIPTVQKSFCANCNESFSVNLTIVNATSGAAINNLFNFTIDADSWWPQPDTVPGSPNQTRYLGIFTPRNLHVGDYNVSINVTDTGNSSTALEFNLSVLNVNHDPVLSNLSNQSTAVNRSFYYNMNVTDEEDGNDTSGTLNTNFNFSYEFLNDGNTNGFLNSTNYNSTTGEINITFNSSQAGKYHLNITVNDSTGAIDSQNIWIYVYGQPSLLAPVAGTEFTLQENVTSVLNFSINHSIGDNLTYDFYVDSISYNGVTFSYGDLVLRESTNYYGNSTNISWSFTPNMTDETYGKLKNLSLVVYPTTSDLENASEINATLNFKLNITHTNHPVTFSGHMSDRGPVAHTSDISLDLTPYFTDYDYSDAYHSQTVTFTVNSNTTSITSSAGWTTVLGASAAVAGLINITASDGSTTATSNSFVVEFVNPSGSSSTSTSSGGTTIIETPVSLKILMPDPVSAYQKDRIVLPITLYNDGSRILKGITLKGSVAKNGTLAEEIVMNFSKAYFSVLGPGKEEDFNLTLEIDTTEVGLFEITVNASVGDPAFEDWGKLFLTIKEGENVLEKILFTEEFIVENPECLELLELVEEAKKYFNEGNVQMALQKADEALKACQSAIAQPSKSTFKQIVENKLYRYLAIGTIIILFGGVGFYSYRRMKLRRQKGPIIQESIKTKNI